MENCISEDLWHLSEEQVTLWCKEVPIRGHCGTLPGWSPILVACRCGFGHRPQTFACTDDNPKLLAGWFPRKGDWEPCCDTCTLMRTINLVATSGRKWFCKATESASCSVVSPLTPWHLLVSKWFQLTRRIGVAQYWAPHQKFQGSDFDEALMAGGSVCLCAGVTMNRTWH